MDEKKARNQDLYRLVGVLKDLMNEGFQPELGSPMLEGILDSRDRYDLDARIYKGIKEHGKDNYVKALLGFYNRMAADNSIVDWMTGNPFVEIKTPDETFVLPERPVPTSPKEMSDAEINEQLLPLILQFDGYDKTNFQDFYTDRDVMRAPSFLRTIFGVHSLGVNEGGEYLDGAGLTHLNTSSKDPVLQNKLGEQFIVNDDDDEESKEAKIRNFQKLRRDMGWYGNDDELLDRIQDLAIRGQFNYYDNNGELDSVGELIQAIAQYAAPMTMEAWRKGDGPQTYDIGFDAAMAALGMFLKFGGLVGKGAKTALGKVFRHGKSIKGADDAADVLKYSIKGAANHPVFQFGGDIIRDVATEAVPYSLVNAVKDALDGSREKTYTTEANPFVTNEFNEGFDFTKSLDELKDGSKIGGIFSSLPISSIRGGKALMRADTKKAIENMPKNWTKKRKQLQNQMNLDDEKFERFVASVKAVTGKLYDYNRTPTAQDKTIQTGRDAADLFAKKYGN